MSKGSDNRLLVKYGLRKIPESEYTEYDWAVLRRMARNDPLVTKNLVEAEAGCVDE